MNWLLFYTLAAFHPIAFVLIGVHSKNWPRRLLLWAMLPLPAIWYCWDYFETKRQHAQMCSEIAGMRILVQPERVDRVRLIGRGFAHGAAGILETYYPRANIVEAVTEQRDDKGVPLDSYVSYTAMPNPNMGSPTDKYPTKEPKALFTVTKIESLTAGVFEVSEQESNIANGIKTETCLVKDGRLYAIHTTLVHWWTGIRYPDALPTWRCPDTNRPRSPTVDAGRTNSTYPDLALTQMLNLILK
jgi:hypothetical protein